MRLPQASAGMQAAVIGVGARWSMQVPFHTGAQLPLLQVMVAPPMKPAGQVAAQTPPLTRPLHAAGTLASVGAAGRVAALHAVVAGGVLITRVRSPCYGQLKCMHVRSQSRLSAALSALLPALPLLPLTRPHAATAPVSPPPVGARQVRCPDKALAA